MVEKQMGAAQRLDNCWGVTVDEVIPSDRKIP